MKTTMAVAEAKVTTSLQWRRLSDGSDGNDGGGGVGGGGKKLKMTMTTAVAARLTATARAVAVAVAVAAATTTTTMTTMATTTMATMIASLATIESTGAAVVLLPHGAKPPQPCHRPAVKRRPRMRTRQSRRLRTPLTCRRTRLCPWSRTEGRRLCPQSRTEGRRRRLRRHRWRQRWRPMQRPPQPPMPTAMLSPFFVKLYNYFLINFGVLGAAVNDGKLAFWGQRRTKGCWRFGGMGEDPMGGGRGFSFLINY